MVGKKDQQETDFPKLEWPKLESHIEFWLALIPYIMGFILLVFPQLTEDTKLYSIRIWIAIVLFLLPIFFILSNWLINFVKTSEKRISYYPKLYSSYEEKVIEIDDLNKIVYELSLYMNRDQIFEIIHASLIEGKMFIVLRKKETPMLHTGDIIFALHNEDARVMGIFQISEIRDSEYYAKGVRNIDALWKAHIRKLGEMRVIPNVFAVYYPEGEIQL